MMIPLFLVLVCAGGALEQMNTGIRKGYGRKTCEFLRSFTCIAIFWVLDPKGGLEIGTVTGGPGQTHGHKSGFDNQTPFR